MFENARLRAKIIYAIAIVVVLPPSLNPQVGTGVMQAKQNVVLGMSPEPGATTGLDHGYLRHNWQQYIRTAKTPIARPVRVVSTSGDVENADALLAPRQGRVAVLTRRFDDTEPTYIVLDYGVEVGGVPSFDVVAATGEPELQVSYSEFLGYVGLTGDGGGRHSADPHRYDIYTPTRPGIVTDMYVQGGERYQMISLMTPGSVSLGSIGIRITHYVASINEYRGHFVCSDAALNKIWYASAYTVQTNMLPAGSMGALLSNGIPVIVDGAKRDRSVWSGDLAIQGLVDYYSTFATEYVRDSLKLLGSNADMDGRVSTNLNAEWPVHPVGSPSLHVRVYSTNYTLWWVQVLADYYLYTGDRKFIQEQWPTLTKELAWASTQVNNNGLLITNSNNGLDWDYYDGPKQGAVTAFNALYYGVLVHSSEMAEAIGEQDQAIEYRSRANVLKNAINSTLFNSSTGVYDVSDVERGTIAQDANVFAVYFGVAPQDKVDNILVKLKKTLWTANGPRPFLSERYRPVISPFISGLELMARFHAGDDRDGFNLLSRLWGRMIRGNDLPSTVWENVSLDGKPGLGINTSLAHGWAAMPVVALSSQVLGIQPTTAGYTTWLIRPHPGDLDWAEGSAPTPAGEIDVRWEHARRTSQFKLHVSAPKGTVGQIALPTFGKSIQAFVNRAIVWNGRAVQGSSAKKDGSYVVLSDLPGGAYDISTRLKR